MKRLKKLFIALTSIFSVISLFPLSACSGGAMHTLTLVNENEDRGTLSGEGSYKTGSQVTVSYTANKGYKFDKWDIDGEQIKISNRTYTFTMPDKDITVTGSFIPKQYEVKIHGSSYNSTYEGNGRYDYGSEVTVRCTPMEGYTFNGWYDDNNKDVLLCAEPVYTFTMPAKDVDLTYRVTLNKYNVSIVVSDPEHVEAWLYNNPTETYYGNTYNISYNFKNITNETFQFNGLYEYVDGKKGELITKNSLSFKMPAHDIVIYVEFVRTYLFTINYLNSGDYVYSSYIPAGQELIYSTSETGLGEFLGWYDLDTGECISDEYTLNITMPARNLKICPRYTFIDSHLTFGSFPQTIVRDKELCEKLDAISQTDEYGYIEYEENKYLRDYHLLKYSDMTLPSGEYKADTDYCYHYFKVEPIKWFKVADFPNGVIALLSTYSIDYKPLLDSDLSNATMRSYKDISFRTYLNNGFYNKAFSSDEKDMIQEVCIDRNTALHITDPTSSSDTVTDKVFLPATDDFALPFFSTPLANYLTRFAVTDYSYFDCSSKQDLYYNYLGKYKTVAYSALRNTNKDGRNMFNTGSYENYFYSVGAGFVLCLRPIIFVKGL